MTKETLRQLVYDLLLQYRRGASAPELWRRPVVRFTDASHPQIARLMEIVHPEHHLTTDFMAAHTVIPVYFLPFSIEVINSNRGGYYASELWTRAYSHSANAVKAIDDGLVRAIQESGYLAVKPTGTSYVTPTTYKSRWSHRHIAYLGGMGTFGMNNLLLTDSGCCGYLSSVVTDLPLSPDKMLPEERCLYKRNGSCGLCLKHCVGDALGAEGFDRVSCYAMVMRTEKYYSQSGIHFVNATDACGKCAAGLPCSTGNPAK